MMCNSSEIDWQPAASSVQLTIPMKIELGCLVAEQRISILNNGGCGEQQTCKGTTLKYPREYTKRIHKTWTWKFVYNEYHIHIYLCMNIYSYINTKYAKYIHAKYMKI